MRLQQLIVCTKSTSILHTTHDKKPFYDLHKVRTFLFGTPSVSKYKTFFDTMIVSKSVVYFYTERVIGYSIMYYSISLFFTKIIAVYYNLSTPGCI